MHSPTQRKCLNYPLIIRKMLELCHWIMDFKPILKIAEEEVKNKHTRENKHTFKKIFLIQVIRV